MPPQGQQSDPRRKDQGPNPMLLMGAGLELAGAAGGFAVIGWWLDGKWGTTPWLMCVGLAIGLIGGFYRLWRVGKRFFR
jgi:F0F1-type ATP synthase assembly protein I